MRECKAGQLSLLGSSKRRHSLGRKCRWRDLSTKQRDEGGGYLLCLRLKNNAATLRYSLPNIFQTFHCKFQCLRIGWPGGMDFEPRPNREYMCKKYTVDGSCKNGAWQGITIQATFGDNSNSSTQSRQWRPAYRGLCWVTAAGLDLALDVSAGCRREVPAQRRPNTALSLLKRKCQA